MSINFDHSNINYVNFETQNLQGNSVLNFPNVNLNDPVEVLVSGRLNISHISGLSGCLSSIKSNSGFYYTNNINGNCSYSYALDSGSVSEVYNSIIFGSHGVAKCNYCHGLTGVVSNEEGRIDSQIVHSLAPFILNGDAQNTTFLSKAIIPNNNFNCLTYGSVCENTVVYADFNVIGKSVINTGCYGVFEVKASLFRGTGNCISTGYFNLNTVVNCNLSQNFTLSITGSNSADWSLFVCNASGIKWLTKASVLEVSATGAESINTIATYWKCTANSGWFNLSNWFSDQYITTALSYPTSSTNVVMSGNCAAFVDIDCNLWLEPNSIDTTRITDAKGICLYSDAGNSFSGNIYGNVTLFGSTVFGNPVQGIHWTNQQDINWFNLSNWYLDSSLQNSASKLPLKTSDVFTYGNSGVCINLDCNLWVQPHSIDATNSTADPSVKVCIYSENSRSFSGIVYGGVTLYGNASFS